MRPNRQVCKSEQPGTIYLYRTFTAYVSELPKRERRRVCRSCICSHATFPQFASHTLRILTTTPRICGPSRKISNQLIHECKLKSLQQRSTALHLKWPVAIFYYSFLFYILSARYSGTLNYMFSWKLSSCYHYIFGTFLMLCAQSSIVFVWHFRTSAARG